MGKSDVQIGIEKKERMKLRSPEQAVAYRALRDILQHEIFDKKNYNISIVELSNSLGVIETSYLIK